VKWTPEERTRVGRRLQKLRNEQGLNQEDIAAKTGMSIGTVQAIEYNKHKVGIENIEAYAAVFGMTASQALHPETIPSTVDPQWQDLNREHLAIARLYMKAYKTVREAVEALLVDDSSRVEITIEMAEVVLALKEATDPHIASWIAFLLLERGDIVVPLARRFNDDPAFEQAVRDLLEAPPTKK